MNVVDTRLLYPKPAETSTNKSDCNITSNITGNITFAPSPFFSQIPTDQILALVNARRLKRPDAMLLLALLAHKRQPGVTEVRPSQRRLAAGLLCCVRTVQRGLERLEAAGLIAKRYMRDAWGRVHGLRYDLANLFALIADAAKATKMAHGPAAPKTSSSAPAPSGEGTENAPEPKRQKCRAELDSDAVGIKNNSAPAPAREDPPPLSPAAEKLVALGMLRRVAVLLAAQAGEERCLKALTAIAQRRRIHNKPAWLVRCLSEGWDLTPAPPAARPQCQSLFRLPAAPADGPADPLDSLPPADRERLEAQARAQLIAELPVLRPILEKGRRTPQIVRRMRDLLGAGGSGGVGDGAPSCVGAPPC